MLKKVIAAVAAAVIGGAAIGLLRKKVKPE